jgi:hypothetical protein
MILVFQRGPRTATTGDSGSFGATAASWETSTPPQTQGSPAPPWRDCRQPRRHHPPTRGRRKPLGAWRTRDLPARIADTILREEKATNRARSGAVKP